MRSYILAESNWKSIKEAEVEVAVLPWGATEAHNYHLPYGTDNFQIEAIAAEAAKRAFEVGTKVLVLPNVPFGVNTGQADIAFNHNIYPSTQYRILNDLIEVLERQGVQKLIILNGHGGNNFKPLLRELGLKHAGMLLVFTNFFQTVDKNVFFEEKGDHADEMETSLMLHLHQDLVLPLEKAGEGQEKKSRITGIREGWAWSERKWSMVSEDTGIGNPKKGTAEKGKKFFDAVSGKIASLITEVAEVDIKDRYH